MSILLLLKIGITAGIVFYALWGDLDYLSNRAGMLGVSVALGITLVRFTAALIIFAVLIAAVWSV